RSLVHFHAHSPIPSERASSTWRRPASLVPKPDPIVFAKAGGAAAAMRLGLQNDQPVILQIYPLLISIRSPRGHAKSCLKPQDPDFAAWAAPKPVARGGQASVLRSGRSANNA